MLLKKSKNNKDVKFILNNLRAVDIEESKFVYGENWKKASLKNIMNPTCQVVIGVDKDTNLPVCMGGVSPMGEYVNGIGVVWFLSTDDIKKHKYSVLKEFKKQFEEYDKTYWFLYNFIFHKNRLAKNWLKWLGFCFDLKNIYKTKVSLEFEFFYRIRKPKGLLD